MKILKWLWKNDGFNLLFLTALVIAFFMMIHDKVWPTKSKVLRIKADCTIEKNLHRAQMDQAYDRIMKLTTKLVRATEELKIYKELGEPQ